MDGNESLGVKPEVKKLSVLVSATFSAEPLDDFFSFWARTFQLDLQVSFAPYGHVFESLLTSDRSWVQGNTTVRLILVRIGDWAADLSKVIDNTHEFIRLVGQSIGRNFSEHIICICPGSPLALNNQIISEQLNQAHKILLDELNSMPAVTLLDGNDIAKRYSASSIHDRVAELHGGIPYSDEFYAAVATFAFRRLQSRSRTPIKVIACDCDNTLWRGIVAEDGVDSIQATANHRRLHDQLIRQKEHGALLCICSRNERADIEKVFKSRADIGLKWDDFILRKINWSKKSTNLSELSAELNIGLDNFLFIDDDPIECAEVHITYPEVLTLQLASMSSRASWLDNYWPLDTVTSLPTSESMQRTQLYIQNSLRNDSIQSFSTLSGFIESLELELRVSSVEHNDLSRVVELMYRTNQFNTTGFKKSPQELLSLFETHGLEAQIFRLSDRFGDYGIVGCIVFSTNDTDLLVKLMSLSCRALGRGVEYSMLAQCGRMAVKRGLQAVVFDFVQSQKNHPALDFLTTIADTGEIIGTKQIFRIQAERAQAAKPMFDDAPAYIGKDGRLPASAPQQANSSVDVRSLSALYLHIATKLETAQAIVEATRVVETLQLDKDVACTPSTDVEQAVARIWGKLLGISVLDNNIDFFDLGGNSLMAIRALSRIQEEYEVTLPLTLFFDDKTTVASIASSIEQALGARIGP